MDTATQTLRVARGPYRLYAEVVPGTGVPVVLMHGFPDNTHLYDLLVPHLAGRRPVVRFDFLGWGRSNKPAGYPYTAANQVGDLAAVIDALSEPFCAAGWCSSRTTPLGRLLLTGRWPIPGGSTRWCCSTPTITGSPPCAAPRHRLVLHAGRPHGGPRHGPALARAGPAVVRLAGETHDHTN